MMRNESLIKRILSRLILEAIVGIVVFATYPHWEEIRTAFKGEDELEEL